MAQESLNSNHARRLSITCRHIDKLLADMENVVNVSDSTRAFPEYLPDITPAQRHVIEDYIARIRFQLARVLVGQGIARPEPSIPMSRCLHTILTFAGIAAEELQPKYMRGYGEIPAAAALELNGIAAELLSLTHQLDQYITRGAGENLRDRLLRLEQAGAEVALLKKLEAIISERGLVEFRSSLSTILDRLADNSFEIAVFGRVSSGKSSLLNATLGTDVLPVGVTPITAVPTRIAYGEIPAVRVWFANRPPEQFPVSRLAGFVAEQSNPGNEKHVTRIVVQMSSPRLREGIVFVDTPGLGSLATRGAGETLAYLPRCDLGVVLIDAGATLTADDVRIVHALYEAGIPANILLSKADLLSPADRGQVIEYVKGHLRSELNLETQVHAVSAQAAARHLLTQWFEKDIAPVYGQSQDLKLRSIRRKVGRLQQSVESALKGRLRQGDQLRLTTEELRDLEGRLRQAGGKLQEAHATLKQTANEIGDLASGAISKTAAALVDLWNHGSREADAPAVLRAAVHQVVAEKSRQLHDVFSALRDELHGTLQRTAQALRLDDVPTSEEFSGCLREMPVLDLGRISVRSTRPAVACLLGRRFAERRTAQRLARVIAPDLGRALTAYRQLASDWSDRTVNQMQRWFDAYANGYRALLERLAGPHELSSEQEQAIRRCLNALQEEQAKQSVPTRS
ncbi:MAG TPA: dynamin family protein [Terriglobales bacterium]|nr:dynamin family protein [Terriglobales bacterium]